MTRFDAPMLTEALPELKWSSDASTLRAYGQDWTRFRQPAPCAVVFPETVEQVQSVVRLAREHGLALVPSGGRTGLAGGAVASRGELVVSLDRMRQELESDVTDRLITVQAGMVLATLRQRAAQLGLYYPVSYAAEGSAQVGGSIATNAGGIHVLRYGMTRNWVAGLAVVTGTGDLLRLNDGLTKNNAGYDLQQLLIGSEGTLGIIVEATLRLTDPPPEQVVMLLALRGLDDLMPVFDAFQRGTELLAFEFFSDRALAAVCTEQTLEPPFEDSAPYYCVVSFAADPSGDVPDPALQCFEQLLEEGRVQDGVLSQSRQQAGQLWQYREGISESITPRTPYKHDLSVRPSRVPAFLQALDECVEQHLPGFEVVWFGHIGDGNLHMNVLRPEDMDIQTFEATCAEFTPRVFELVKQFRGSISAEHGIGILKQPYLEHSRSAEEIALMRGIKARFDPDGIMNPGKILPVKE